MPIYAYRCSSCGFQQDVLQKMSDAPLTVCPSCGQSEFHKQLSAPAFQLKGTGWYVTDFRDNGTKPAGQNGKSGGRDGDASGAASGSASPAAGGSSSGASGSTGSNGSNGSTGGGASGGSSGASSPSASPASGSSPSAAA